MTLTTTLTTVPFYKLISLVRGRYGWNGASSTRLIEEGHQPLVSINPEGGCKTLSVKTWPVAYQLGGYIGGDCHIGENNVIGSGATWGASINSGDNVVIGERCTFDTWDFNNDCEVGDDSILLGGRFNVAGTTCGKCCTLVGVYVEILLHFLDETTIELGGTTFIQEDQPQWWPREGWHWYKTWPGTEELPA
jgi:hypothetical protein